MTRAVLDAFYGFAFAVCRDPGKKHLQVSPPGALVHTQQCAVCSHSGPHAANVCMPAVSEALHRVHTCSWLPQVDRAVALWRVLLHQRFRLLYRFCAFVECSPRLVVSEDTWRQACRTAVFGLRRLFCAVQAELTFISLLAMGPSLC